MAARGGGMMAHAALNLVCFCSALFVGLCLVFLSALCWSLVVLIVFGSFLLLRTVPFLFDVGFLVFPDTCGTDTRKSPATLK